MIALDAGAAATTGGPMRLSGRAAGAGFGEAWNATRAADPPPQTSQASKPAADPRGTGTAQQADTPKDKGDPPAKPVAKRTRSGAAADPAPATEPTAPGPDTDLAALNGMIAAMTGRAPATAAAAPTADAATTATPADGVGQAAIGASLAGDGIGLASVDAGAIAFVLDPQAAGAAADPAAAAANAAAPADLAVSHQLDLAGDGAWLDQLTRDIARSADADGQLRFSLSPERLGRLDVQLAAGADGTAIRLTTETREAHRIVTDAQPQLVAEARAQGLRISETHVDLNGGGGAGAGHQSFGNQNSGGGSSPQRFRAPAGSDAPAPAPTSGTGPADALYA